MPFLPRIMASYALHWHLMQEAFREGYAYYDFYGFAPIEQREHPYWRFSRFKEKFGGRHVRYIGSHDRIFYDELAAVSLQSI